MTVPQAPQTQTTAGNAVNTTLDVIIRMVSQNLTPVIVGLLCAKLPVLSESTWFQITVFVLAGLGSAISTWTPDSIWNKSAAIILLVRRGFKQVQDAQQKPLN